MQFVMLVLFVFARTFSIFMFALLKRMIFGKVQDYVAERWQPITEDEGFHLPEPSAQASNVALVKKIMSQNIPGRVCEYKENPAISTSGGTATHPDTVTVESPSKAVVFVSEDGTMNMLVFGAHWSSYNIAHEQVITKLQQLFPQQSPTK